MRCGGAALLITVSLITGGCQAARPRPSSVLGTEAVEAPQRDDLAVDRRALVQMLGSGDPDQAAMAWDILAQQDGRRLYPDNVSACPPQSREAFAAAEEHFQAQRFAAAIPLYESAIAACPDNGQIRVSYADAFYRTNDLARARVAFREGLARDRWNRAGHRYLSDTEHELGNRAEAFREALLAVLSDPTYELGWMTVRQRASESGRTVQRERVVKPVVGAGSGPLQLTVDPNVHNDVWMAYALSKATARDDGASSAFEIEKRAVQGALSYYGEKRYADGSAAADTPELRFWRAMDDARKAGFLDEAIYVRLLDQPMAADYAAFRERNGDRLLAYVERFVVPAPGAASVAAR